MPDLPPHPLLATITEPKRTMIASRAAAIIFRRISLAVEYLYRY
jgi:hypothetical protein